MALARSLPPRATAIRIHRPFMRDPAKVRPALSACPRHADVAEAPDGVRRPRGLPFTSLRRPPTECGREFSREFPFGTTGRLINPASAGQSRLAGVTLAQWSTENLAPAQSSAAKHRRTRRSR